MAIQTYGRRLSRALPALPADLPAGSRASLLAILLMALLVATAAIFAGGVHAGARQGRYGSVAATVVQPQAYVSLDPVPRGQTFEIALVAKIMPGYHVNAHMPSEDYLIPTRVTPDLPAGITLLGTTYPPGVIRKFQFAASGLRVYEDSFTVRLKLHAAGDAPLGPQKIALAVGYQACNEDACLPPVKIPAAVELQIAAANAPAHRANPAIFKDPVPGAAPASH